MLLHTEFRCIRHGCLPLIKLVEWDPTLPLQCPQCQAPGNDTYCITPSQSVRDADKATVWGYCRLPTHAVWRRPTDVVSICQQMSTFCHTAGWSFDPRRHLFLDAGADRGSAAQRLAFTAMSEQLVAGDRILLPHLAAAFRTVPEAASLLDAWMRRGITPVLLECNGVPLDFGTALGTVALHVLHATGAFHRNVLSEYALLGLARDLGRRAARIMRWTAPGSRWIVEHGRTIIVPDPPAIAQIAQFRLWRQEGMSYAQMAAEARRRNMSYVSTTRRRRCDGDRQWNEIVPTMRLWTESTIRSALKRLADDSSAPE